jgi:hypothetical protein
MGDEGAASYFRRSVAQGGALRILPARVCVEKRKAAGDNLALQRWATRGRMHEFVGVGDLKESEFGSVKADKLQTQGQS